MEPYDPGEFLPGFLEEAGEHLSSIKRDLLRLEELLPPMGQSQGEADSIEQDELLGELFRSYHTLKGLAGMVGLEKASLLSHAMESVLKGIQNGVIVLTQEVIDRLIKGTQLLSQVVESQRKSNAVPISIDAPLEALDQLLEVNKPKQALAQPATAGVQQADQSAHEKNALPVLSLLPGLSQYLDLVNSLGELEQKKIMAAAREGQYFALAVFASSAERAKRGENVDWMRQRIQEAATLIKAAPSISEGGIRFYFLFASRHPIQSDMGLADEVIPLTTQIVAEKTRAELPPASRRAEVFRSSVVRVELARLDDLMRSAGELILLRSRISTGLALLKTEPKKAQNELHQANQQLGRKLRSLRQGILRTRMVPLAETFNHMPLVVRDLARASHKNVRLHLQGEMTEVDKLLVEGLLDPLIHLVRNAITHGIEEPEEREKGGKKPAGNLTLRAIPQGDHILIEVSDDGRGIQLEEVARQASQAGGLEAGQAITAEDAMEWIIQPGFSTQVAADLVAGRGIGLDVVQRMVRSFGGKLSMKTEPGQGTTFTLRLPLTLVIVDVILVQSGVERYAVRREDIARIIEIQPNQIVQMQNGELLPKQEGFYLIYRLSKLFRSDGAGSDETKTAYGLVIEMNASGHAANQSSQQPVVLVDKVLGMQEVVVQPVTDPLVSQPGIGGTTEMGDGSAVLILDITTLLRITPKATKNVA